MGINFQFSSIMPGGALRLKLVQVWGNTSKSSERGALFPAEDAQPQKSERTPCLTVNAFAAERRVCFD